MKYKYFLMLVLLSSSSFMGISSGNVKKEFSGTCCKNVSGKCTRQTKTVNAESNPYRFTPINHLLFM